MIETITYKTKIEELLNISDIERKLNNFRNELNQKQIKISQEYINENYKIIELAKIQRKKELKKLLEKVIIRINRLDEILYNLNEKSKQLKSNKEENNQIIYENAQVMNFYINSKTKLEDKRNKIYNEITML